MTDLAQMLTESEDALAERTRERDEARDTIEGLDEQLEHANMRLSEAWERVRENPDVEGPEKQSLAEAVGQACDAAYAQGAEGLTAAQDHLRAYLVSRGLPSDPVKLDDPHLDALARVLL